MARTKINETVTFNLTTKYIPRHLLNTFVATFQKCLLPVKIISRRDKIAESPSKYDKWLITVLTTVLL